MKSEDNVFNIMAGVDGEGDMIHTLSSWTHDTGGCTPPGGGDNDIGAGPPGLEPRPSPLKRTADKQ